MAERLKECDRKRSKIRGNLRKRLASRFHIPLHIGSSETSAVSMRFFSGRPSRREGLGATTRPPTLPVGSSEGPGSRLVQP